MRSGTEAWPATAIRKVSNWAGTPGSALEKTGTPTPQLRWFAKD